MTFRRLLIAGSFIAMLLIGVLAHDEYGVSADEPAMKKFGHDTFSYLFEDADPPSAIDWTFHGPAVQLLLAAAQRVMGFTDGADIWFLRHLINFLIFFAGLVCFYVLAKTYIDDWRLALLATAFLFLSPRIFAHAFFNPKDLPALSFFIMSAYTLTLVWERPRIHRLLLHALVTGLLISLRTFGLIIPLVGFGYLFSDWLHILRQSDASDRDRRASLQKIVLYPLAIITATIAVWPALWEAPIKNFLMAVTDNLSRDGGGLYMGALIRELPWHYLFVWIGITTPLLYSVFFLAGCVLLLWHVLPHPVSFAKHERLRVLVFMWLFLPFIAFVVLRPGIFDGWRHLFFVYPAFLLIGLDFLAWAWAVINDMAATTMRRIVKVIAVAILILSITSPAWWMLRNHPFEYAYFSIPASFADGNFELDSWGLSYRAGLEYILATDKREKLTVYAASRVAVAGADTLPLAEWERLYFVDSGEADYVLDTFAPNGYQKVMPAERALHSIVVDGVTILTVYKGTAPEGAFRAQEWYERE